MIDDIRRTVLADGTPLGYEGVLACLRSSDDELTDLLALAHEVRLKWCGPEVEAEGIVSLKTGGCPEDCHFCSQSGKFDSPVRATSLDLPTLVAAARDTAATGATEFCIVAAVRGPDERLMRELLDAVAAIRAAVEINVAVSIGILDDAQVARLVDAGVHRVNHNLETARSYFGSVVTTHTWEERWETCVRVRDAGLELCCGGIVGMGETVEQRAEFATELAALGPHEVPLNFFNPRPGTPFGHLPLLSAGDALRAVAAFRLAVPRTLLRFAGGREVTLGPLAERGLVGGVNAIILGNYLTTLGGDPAADLAMLDRLKLPLVSRSGAASR